MTKLITEMTDREIVAIVEHFEQIERLGRLPLLTAAEKAEFNTAYDEFTDRELR